MGAAFWEALDTLVAGSRIVVDRPRWTPHPRFPDVIYPRDYGYLDGTRAGDGMGVDVWLGSLPDRRPTGIVCTVDLAKQECEVMDPRLRPGACGYPGTTKAPRAAA